MGLEDQVLAFADCAVNPMQFDCAYDPKTAAKKMPNSKITGYANVYIFPDLNAVIMIL